MFKGFANLFTKISKDFSKTNSQILKMKIDDDEIFHFENSTKI